jgi:prepilin peptidase CpaA
MAGGAFTVMLVCACVSDLRTRRIPNQLVLLLAVTGLAYSSGIGSVAEGLARGFGGLGVGLIFWLPFWLLGWLGAGDVKLFAAAAAWLGPWGAVEAAVLGALLGGVFAAVWLGWERGVRVALEKSLLAMVHPRVLASPAFTISDRRRLVPYGIALALSLAITAWFPALVSIEQVLQ